MSRNYWESLDTETKKRHKKEFKIWLSAISYGMSMVKENKWNQKQRQEYMIKIAKEVRLPNNDIRDMEFHLQKM